MYFLYWCYYPTTSIGWVVSQRLGFKAADWFRSYGDENMRFCRAGKFSKGVALVQRGSAIKKSTRCILLCCVSIAVMISNVMQSLIERRKNRIGYIPNPLQRHLLKNSQLRHRCRVCKSSWPFPEQSLMVKNIPQNPTSKMSILHSIGPRLIQSSIGNVHIKNVPSPWNLFWGLSLANTGHMITVSDITAT